MVFASTKASIPTNLPVFMSLDRLGVPSRQPMVNHKTTNGERLQVYICISIYIRSTSASEKHQKHMPTTICA
jgi:hypothetical protein